MASLFLIAPLAVIFCMIAVAAWLWASNSGQYDDLDREGQRILFDEDLPPEQRRLPGTTASAQPSPGAQTSLNTRQPDSKQTAPAPEDKTQ